MQTGLLRQFGRCDQHPVRHRFVEPEAIAEQYACATKGDAEVPNQLSHKLVQLFRIWLTHCSLLWCLLSSLLHSSQVGKHPRGARQAFESEAFSLITLTNFGSGGGMLAGDGWQWRLRSNLGRL